MQVKKRHSNELTSSTPGVVCAKLFCAERASASLVFNPRRAEAWLLPVPAATEDSISMCRFHAEIFKAPVDWVFTDQRTAEDEPSEPFELSEPSERTSEEVLAPVDLVYPENGASEENGANPEEVESLAVSDESESDSPENDKTPLLARAFRNSQSLLGES